MPTPELRAESRFNRTVLGGWWSAVSVLGLLRLWRGDYVVAAVLLASATFTALLGLALSKDRERADTGEADDAESLRLQKATVLFSVIAITTVVACAVLKGVLWWAAVECAAVVWILPAAILPLFQAYVRKRLDRRWGAQPLLRSPAETPLIDM